MARFLKDRYLWYIVAIMVLTGILLYTSETYVLGWLPSQEKWHLTYLTLLNIMFLMAVAISAWRFGVRGGLAVCFIAGLILLPHAMLEVVSPLRTDWGAELMVIGAVGVIFSWLIGTRKRAEEAIKRSYEFSKTILNSMNDTVSIINVHDYSIVGVNNAFLKLLGVAEEEVIGKTCYAITHYRSEPCIPPDDICPLLDTVTSGEHSVAEHVHYCADGEKIYVDVSTSPIKDEEGRVIQVVHVVRDITERKQREEKLIMTQRLASIGELASGIAHELNNPLTGVIGFSGLLLQKDVPDDIREDIKVIHHEAKRAVEVVKNLLTFARKHTPVRQLVNINSLIEKVLELRAYEQRVSNIQVITSFAPDLPQIMADYFQLQQVFLNIVINAEYFMTEAHNKGTLTITTERVGDIIRASFADDGPGIAKENLGHIFDPFFTTKEVGKGTGLGLSICHGIITEHGGNVYAESELGKGATFVVELHVVDHSNGQTSP